MDRAERFRFTRCLCSLIVIVLFSSSASARVKKKVLYRFQGIPDGATPAGGVVFDQRGNLYGTTTNSGSSSCHGCDNFGNESSCNL